jgi:hypothetical protein
VTHYKLTSTKQLGHTLKVMARKSRQETLEALRKTARFGVTAIQTRITSMPKAPVDTGQYLRSFRSKDTHDGAEVTTSEQYAPIIELGRRAGSKPPPLKEIEEWLARKMQRPKAKRKRKKKVGRPRKAGSRGKKVRKAGKRKTKAKRKTKEERFKLRARAIQMSIHRRGIAPRRPVFKSLPAMRSYLAKELKRAMDKSSKPS